MAETKRATAERVATPRTGGQPVADTLKNFSNAIGARVKLTTSAAPSQTLEGILFTACPIFNVVAINTAPAPPNPTSAAFAEPGNYHVIPISTIQSFQVLSLVENKDGFATALPPIGKLDTAKLKEREQQRVKKLKEEEAKKGKGVTAEAQALFNALDRMYAARWHGTDIIVDDSVIISAPYTVDTCKAPKEKQSALAYIRKIVEGEKRKFADRSRGASPMPRKGG
ncbi:Protein LSM12 A [Elsinoe australis]|uniref:Protein LSM12 A n=1 Tax=Elsinoe australis TaxID=40998 RepID=A0A2P8A8R6_9PEZI|nr:Protein LSM12 A [Elsinoe australis]